MAISPDGQYVAAGSLDKSVRVWDSRNGYVIERLDGIDGHKDSVYSVAFAPNGRDIVSGSLDKTIKMWELGSANGGMMSTQGARGGKCIRTFEGHKVRLSKYDVEFGAQNFVKLFLGLCFERCSYPRRPLGNQRLERPRSPVLGSANRRYTVDVTRP